MLGAEVESAKGKEVRFFELVLRRRGVQAGAARGAAGEAFAFRGVAAVVGARGEALFEESEALTVVPVEKRVFVGMERSVASWVK